MADALPAMTSENNIRDLVSPVCSGGKQYIIILLLYTVIRGIKHLMRINSPLFGGVVNFQIIYVPITQLYIILLLSLLVITITHNLIFY